MEENVVAERRELQLATKPIRIGVQFHRTLKKMSAEQGVSMREIAEQALANNFFAAQVLPANNPNSN